MMRLKTSLFMPWVLALLPLVMGSCTGHGAGQAKQGNTKGRALNVTGYVVYPDTLDIDITATGTVLANEEVELHSEVSGKVTGIFFKEGEFVPKSKMLVKINDQELQAELQRARYQEDLAQSDESRKRQLLEARGISKEEYEVSQNKLNTTRADITLIQAQIAKTEVIAPFSGRIGLRNISEGAYISPSVTISSLQQTSPVKIEFYIPQKYIHLVGPGTPILFYDEKGKDYPASVYATDAKVDESMRTIKVRALFDNTGNQLVPGMFVKVIIRSEAKKNALVIPAESIVPVMNGEKVFIASMGKALPRSVITGYRTETRVEILEGLKSGDTIITSGILMMRDSMAVNMEKILNR